MNEKQIINQIIRQNPSVGDDVIRKLFKQYKERIIKGLLDEGTVIIKGIAIFEIADHRQHRAFSFSGKSKGEIVTRPATKTVKVRVSKKLKDLIRKAYV